MMSEKVGIRELPLAVAAGRHAATTVASTGAMARRAGVRVFATGGVGGVHRGAAESFDESADLAALAHTPITVVCAGVKSILDVAATLERLETLGVTVTGYRTRRFPGFYVSDSGFDLDWSAESPREVAVAHAGRRRARPRQCHPRRQPGPPRARARPRHARRAAGRRPAAAEAAGVHGKSVTPFLLDHIYRASHGASLEANVWAVRNNVAVAAEIAAAFNSLAP